MNDQLSMNDQQQLAAYIRNPQVIPPPANIEERRLAIYRELFFNNIKGFIDSGFPITRKLFSRAAWQHIIRDFFIHHRCDTPYFLEISQEFIIYLQTERKQFANDPPFLSELAHYEWLELALDVAEQDIEQFIIENNIDLDGDLYAQRPAVSPVAWSASYHYPVHMIGPDCIPTQAADQPVCLVVYRNRADQVKFLETNPPTLRLLALLNNDNNGDRKDPIHSGEHALRILVEELQHPNFEQLREFGLQTLKQLRDLEIVLGSYQ